MKLQGKFAAMREDFEKGRFPLVPTSGQLETNAACDTVANRQRTSR